MKRIFHKSSLFKWLLWLVIIGLSVYLVVTAVNAKQSLQDYPALHFSDYEDVLEKFDGRLFDALEGPEPEYYNLDNYLSSHEILVVEPTGRLGHQTFMALQELKVIDVLQGDVTLKDKTINLMSPHLGSLSTDNFFGSYTNILLPDERYIVFLEPYENVNQYATPKLYSYQYDPGAFTLGQDNTTVITPEQISIKKIIQEEPYDEYEQKYIAYQDVKDKAYFAIDEEALQIIKNLRKDLLDHFDLR